MDFAISKIPAVRIVARFCTLQKRSWLAVTSAHAHFGVKGLKQSCAHVVSALMQSAQQE